MARTFAADSDYVGDFASAAPGTSLSVYAWVKSPIANGRINTAAQWRIDFDASSNLRFVREWTGSTSVWHADMTGVTLTDWNHYAATHDGTSTANAPIFYINGSVVATTQDSAPVGATNNGTSVWALGNRSSGVGLAKLGGSLDWFGWHNVVLTSAQVAEAMKNGSSTTSPFRIVHLAGVDPELDTAGGTSGAVNGTTFVDGPPDIPMRPGPNPGKPFIYLRKNK